MKKIGITCYPTLGGSGVIATELGKMLEEQGHEIHFITSSMPFRLDRIYPNIYYHEVEISNYPVFQYPPYDLALAAKMAEVVDREHIEILHVHYAMPHAISAILARDLTDHPVKVVTTLHGTDITVLGFDPTFKKMISHGIEQSDAVTAVSNSLVKQTKEKLGVKRDISVIYNFVNEQEYYKRNLIHIKKQYNIKSDEKVVIHISNFRKVKRVEDVIHTFSKIQSKVKAKLLLVGDGPETSTAFRLVKKLGLEQHVLFLGKQKKVSELLSISDLKLLLSEQESFGVVLLEAMMCKVPCIGTRVGGIPEVVDHGKTGYLVELGDIDQAAAYGIELLTNEEKWQAFSDDALVFAKTHFHSEHILKQYNELYNDVLSR